MTASLPVRSATAASSTTSPTATSATRPPAATSSTMMPPTTTTTTPAITTGRTAVSKASQRPLLLCTIRAPSNQSHFVVLANQRLPDPGICDHTIVEIGQSQDGSYNETLYQFLQTHAGSYLFTLQFRGSVEAVRRTIDQPQFASSAHRAVQSINLSGFGLFPTDPGISMYRNIGDIQRLEEIYQRIEVVLRRPQGRPTVFFLGFVPFYIRTFAQTYAAFLEDVKHLPIVVIILTITTMRDPLATHPEATAAWDTDCLFYQEQPRMMPMVHAIANVTAPSAARFALTMSLRMDVFKDVSISSIVQSPGRLNIPAGTQRLTPPFATMCWTGVYRHDAQGTHFAYLSGETCVFASYSDGRKRGIAAFETTRSIEKKMQKARLMLAYLNASNTHRIAWLAHDVSFNIAPTLCGGDFSRLLKMRQMA